MINTHIQQTQSQNHSVISASSSHTKLIRRTSKSKSLKIKRSDSSQSDFDKSFPTYFIKKVPKFNAKNNEEELSTTDVTPNKVIKRKSENGIIEEKKRQPTPVKSYREIVESEKTSKKGGLGVIDMQREMEIHELQKKLQCESKIRVMFEQRSKQFENEVSVQVKKVKSLEKELQIARQKQILLKQRITEIEGQLESKSNDLKSTKSNLQKLKENIKEVRNQEFQAEMKKVNEEVTKYKEVSEEQGRLINCLKNDNTSLKMELSRISDIAEQNKLRTYEECKTHTLNKEIESLKAQLKMSRSEKQIFLEQKLLDFKSQLQSFKKVHHSKLIEIDFLNRKKHQELQHLKKRKNQEIKGLRYKFAALMDEYKRVKCTKRDVAYSKEKELKGNHLRVVENREVEKRQNRFACPIKDRSDEDWLCFSLSPDVK